MGKSKTIRLTNDKVKVILNLFEHVNGNGSSNSINLKKFLTDRQALNNLVSNSYDYIMALDVRLRNEVKNEFEFKEVQTLITILTAETKLVESILKYEEIQLP